MIEVSAPGKIHIIGEHSVVYGFPAIISAIDKRIKIKAEKSKKVKIINLYYKKIKEFDTKEVFLVAKKAKKLWQEGNKKNDFSQLFDFLNSNFWKRSQAMVGIVMEKLGLKKEGIFLEISTNLPIGKGLGSSASFSVSLVKAISCVYGLQLKNEQINNIAFELEKLNHGRPSGGDNTVCTFGGTIWFEKGKIKKISLPSFFSKIFVILTERKKGLDTGYYIEKVKRLKKEIREKLMKNLGEIAQDFKKAFKEKDLEKIKYLINKAQENLEKLGISNYKIEKIANLVREKGGALKISGGGAGALICFHEDKRKLKDLLEKMKLSFFETKLGEKGVKIESYQ